MSSLSENLGALARGGGQLLRFPTAFLLGWASLVLVILTWQVWALLAPAGGPGLLGTVLLVAFVVLLALPVLVLGLRRRRWLRLTEPSSTADRPTVVVGSQELIRIDSLSDKVEDDMTGMEGEEDVRAVMDAFTEVQLPEVSRRGAGARMTRLFGVGRLAIIGRVFGRMERAQRALLTAAGGPTKAPYLVDDLRVTVAAFLGTLLTICLGGLSILVLAAVLLAR